MKYKLELAKVIRDSMEGDDRVLVLGESVTDPRGIFGTTKEVASMFPDRVIETPLSETMLTGACLGLALEGWKPIYVHARTDFLFLTMEHLVNTIAKWDVVHQGRHFNLVIRALIGRGWGQGPNHSQAIHSMFAHVPGLRVLYPVDPKNLSYWFKQALYHSGPTIILEPRRLYEVETIEYPIWKKPDVYVMTFGDVILDAADVAVRLSERDLKVQVMPVEDLTNITLPEGDTPVIVVDTGHLFFGAAAEVMTRLGEKGNFKTKRVGPPFLPLPTSYPLEAEWYPSLDAIAQAIGALLNVGTTLKPITNAVDDAFRGPF